IATAAREELQGANPPTQEHEQKQKYTCRMHHEVMSEQPGECPICGMKLVPTDSEKHSASIDREQGSHAQYPTSNGTHESHGSHSAHGMHQHTLLHHSTGESDHGHNMSSMQMAMPSSIDLADPMSREGSGTSWLPDSSPMYGKMLMFGENMLMLHGAI